jgi:hypothetical protein
MRPAIIAVRAIEAHCPHLRAFYKVPRHIPLSPESARTMAGISSLMQAIKLPDTAQPFDRLVRVNWTGQLLITFGGMIASFFIAGFWYPYWRVGDMDMFVVYNAFLLNDHQPQAYFDHPGYLPILLLSYWLRALHGIHLISADSLSTLPPASDATAFNAALMQATQAGRVLSLLLAMGVVAAFAYLLRAFIRDPRIAGLGAFLFAFSGGMAMLMRTMRTELLSAGLFAIALLMMLVAARRGPTPWRPAVVGLAAALITLGIQSKIQIFFLICALPVLLLPFGPEPALPIKQPDGFWQRPQTAWPALAAAAAIAAIAMYLAKDLLLFGFSHDVGRPVGISATIYWAMVAMWIGLGMIAYSIIWRVAVPETLAAMLAALTGCMIGLLALYLRYNPTDVAVVFHPLETMYTWAAASYPQLVSSRFLFLLNAIGGVIARRTFFLSSSPRPTIFLEWFVIVATVIAIRRRQWSLVAAVAALMLTDWGIDTLGMGRHLEQAYFLFTDPLAIIAAALLITQLKDLQQHRWAYGAGVALIAVTIVVSQAEPVKHLFKTAGPEVLCEPGMHHYYPRLELPFCPQQPVNPR